MRWEGRDREGGREASLLKSEFLLLKSELTAKFEQGEKALGKSSILKGEKNEGALNLRKINKNSKKQKLTFIYLLH